MIDELSKLNWCEITLLISFLIVFTIFILVAFLSVFLGDMSIKHIHYEGKPYKYCKDCHGTGIINPGDKHFECECPCKMVIEH